MKKRGATGTEGYDQTVSRSELLRAFGRLAVYAAPGLLLASQAGCDESTGGGGAGGDDDTDCSFSSVASGSFSSVSCSSESESESSSECLPGVDCAAPA